MVHKLELDNQLKRFGHPSSGVKAWPVGGHGARSHAPVREIPIKIKFCGGGCGGGKAINHLIH